jgi:hypothetical protein
VKRCIGLLIAATVAAACGSDGAAAPAPIEVHTSVAPDVGEPAHRQRPCDVNLEDIVPAMLTGVDPADGSWHLAAHAEITSRRCRDGGPRQD